MRVFLLSRTLYSSQISPSHRCPAQFLASVAHYASARRKFHTSRKSQSALLDTCCSQTHETIRALYDITGLPWVATLPLTAILLRSTIVLPLSIWSRRQTQRVASVRPLLHAWLPIIQERVIQRRRRAGPSELEKTVRKEMKLKQKTIFTNIGIRPWGPYVPLLQLPIWLLVIETIRRMCGAGTGLLALIFRQFDGVPADGEALAGSSSSLIEASLSTEGALWFPDLLASDPMLILPFTLSAVVFSNIKLHQMSDRNAGIVPSTISRRLDKTMMLLAIAIGPVTLHLPAAILIYWITSALFATVQTTFFNWFMPLPRSPIPCKPKQRPYMTNLFG